MRKYLILLVFAGFLTSSYAQTNEQLAKPENLDGWSRKASIGLDLAQLININPYVGAGSNRLGLGGAINYKANYKEGLFSWNNDLLFNVSVQRIGSGNLSGSSSEKIPFEKALDMVVLNTNFSYLVKEASPWAYSLDLGLRTQLLGSYIDSATNKIYLKDLDIDPYHTKLVSKLFSPALITLAPGIKYSKDKKFQLFFSPIAGQLLIISDQEIANLGVHGTKLRKGSATEYETSKFALGALAKAIYSNTYFGKLNVTSELSLFSDYLDNPQNIDVVWMNNYSVELFKGFNVGLRLDLFYDDNKLNNISDSNAVGGFSGTGKRVNVIQQLLLTYIRNF